MVLRERDGVTRWELPSGLLEEGETFEQAAIRETLEETGVTVELGELLCTVLMAVPAEEYRGLNAYFFAHALQDMPQVAVMQDEPIKEVAFINLTQMNPNQIHPVDRRILRTWRRYPDRRPFYLRVEL
jgi:ADP-ribose pyrophosphatase YjhB (NUDIX family)